MDRAASNPPEYSLRRILAYDELQKLMQPKLGKLDRWLQSEPVGLHDGDKICLCEVKNELLKCNVDKFCVCCCPL
jgi:hypothetical protein